MGGDLLKDSGDSDGEGKRTEDGESADDIYFEIGVAKSSWGQSYWNFGLRSGYIGLASNRNTAVYITCRVCGCFKMSGWI